MFAERPQRMSVEEFLEWEQLQDEKHELVDGVPVLWRVRKWGDGDPNNPANMMAGGSVDHGEIARNIIHNLSSRLAGGHCRPLGPTSRFGRRQGRLAIRTSMSTAADTSLAHWRRPSP